jgi:hypothetical protein
MLKNDAMQVPANMEQQPWHADGTIGHVSPSDLVEVGDIYKRMNDFENMEGEDIMANMPTIEERLKGLGLKHNNIEKAFKIPLFEGSTLSSLCATLLTLNCCHIHGASNAFIIELLGLFF